MKKKLPIVAIVGRMNVGKSTLFNRLSERAKSITYDYSGVTRDVITDTICWRDHCFELVDTGGMSLKKITDDPIAEKVRQRAIDAVEQADVILFVVDGIAGIVQEDQSIARWLRKINKPTILVINKMDSTEAQEQRYLFDRLGFKYTVGISAQHGLAIADLFDELLPLLPAVKLVEEKEAQCRVVILGKPNVGKSSLLNLLVKKERAIVADLPGTTREAIKEKLQFFKESIEIIDTPGIRRKRGVTEPIEKLMVKSALNSIDEANIVILVIDASEGRMVDQELKLAFYVFEQRYKGLIILYNKDDLVDEQTREDLTYQLSIYRYFLDKVIEMRTSMISQKNIGKLLQKINDVCTRYMQRFSDEELFQLFKEALTKKPLYRAQQRLIVYNVKQVRTGPITIELTVGEPRWFGPSQLGFLEGILRKHADLKGVPIKWLLAKKRQT